MKYGIVILVLSLTGSAIAACSATGNHTLTTGAGGSASTGGGGPGATSGPGVTGSGGASTASGGMTTGSGGGATTGGATTSSSGSMTTSTSGSGGPIDFDGGWQIPDSGMMPPLVGDGGITVEIGPGADASSPGKFGGPATGSAPTLVYPPNGVILPPNTNSLEFHFIPAPGQTLFEFVFHAPTTDLHVFVGCTPLGSGCVYKPDATFWSSLVAYARGTQPVTYTLKGVNGGSPAAVGTTAPASIAFSQQDMTGGIYYWNTAGVVQRYDYGIPTAAPQLYLSAADVGGLFCVGCHVLSRDGDRIAAGADIPSPAPYKVLDVVSKAPVYAGGQPLSGQSNFFSFSPDGKQLLLSDGVAIGWRDLVNGNIVNPQVVNPGTMPDWSPDGLHMVYARPKNPPPFNFPVPGVDSAAIMTMHFNGTSWDTPVTLVPFAGQNNYYPAYAPTGQWIVFNRSPSNAESFANAGPDPDAGTVPDGELWAVAASGGAAVRLDKASNPGACSWPKWAPVLHDYYGGKLMWLTVSSARAYGLRLAAGAQTQLWMVGFDPARAALGQDPSFPGFWLPFQDIGGGNHIAQWTTKVPRKPCTMPTDCPSSEICKNGHCVPPG